MCTKRVKSIDTGRPLIQKYGSTSKNRGRPVNLWVDPYFRNGSTRIFSGPPVYYGSTRMFTCLLAFTGRETLIAVYPTTTKSSLFASSISSLYDKGRNKCYYAPAILNEGGAYGIICCPYIHASVPYENGFRSLSIETILYWIHI